MKAATRRAVLAALAGTALHAPAPASAALADFVDPRSLAQKERRGARTRERRVRGAADALAAAEARDAYGMEPDGRDPGALRARKLLHYTVVFEECVGKHIDECRQIIAAYIASKPQIYAGETGENPDHPTYEKKPIRTPGDLDNYKVGLRTNKEETSVAGVLGDGMVFYPWDWCLPYEECQKIGPWDCHIGTPLPYKDCCDMILADFPLPNRDGNKLECFADYPIGSTSNPVNYNRVIIDVNSEDIVVRAPRNE